MAKINKKLLFKIGTSLGAATAVVAPLATLVSCGQSDLEFGQSWKFGSHRELQEVFVANANDLDAIGKHQYKASTSYMTKTSTTSKGLNSEILSFFRQVKDSTDKIEKTSNGNVKIVQDTSSKLRFEMIEGLKIIGTSSSDTYEFDNDALTKHEADSWHLNESDLRVTKEWSKSINYVEDGKTEPFVLQWIKAHGLSSIELNFRKNLSDKHWMNQFGGVSKSTIKPEDFYTGLQQQLFSLPRTGARAQYSGGLTKEQFESALVLLNASPLLDRTPLKVPNGSSPISPLEMAESNYGIDLAPLVDDNKKGEMLSGDTFKLNFSGKSNDVLAEFFNEQLIKGAFFGAYSTDEVNNLKNKYNSGLEDALKQTITTSSKTYSLSDEVRNKFLNSKYFQSGFIQTLAGNKNEHHIAGEYYITESNSKGVVFEQNPEYVDDRWLNFKNQKGELATIKTYRVKFIAQGTQSNLMLLNEYKAGTNITAPFSGLNTNDKIAAIDDENKWGLAFKQEYYANTTVYGDYSAFILNPLLSDTKPGSVYFNDNYSKLMYGYTIDELKNRKDATDQRGTISEFTFGGTGFQFRTSLAAALNDYSMIKQGFEGNIYTDWSSRLAPDAEVFPGTGITAAMALNIMDDQEVQSKLTAENIDVEEFKSILSKSYVSFNGTNIEVAEVSRQSYKDAFVDAFVNRMGPLKDDLEKIKLSIIGALDAAQIPTNEQVIWEWPFGRGMTSPTLNPAYQAQMEFIRSIDPRLMPVAKLAPIPETSSGSSVTILQKDLTPSFNLTETIGSEIKPWVARVHAQGVGYSAGSVNLTTSALTTGSPADAITSKLNYLQTGDLLGLSYLADHKNMYENVSGLMGIKPIIEALSSTLQPTLQTEVGTNLSSSKATEFKAALDKLTLEQIYKTTAADIATHDYFGFGGLEVVKAEMESDDPLIQKDISIIEDAIGAWFNESSIALNQWFNNPSTTPSDMIRTIKAFDLISTESINAAGNKMDNKLQPKISLQKTWLTSMSPDAGSALQLSRMYVDFDRKDGNPVIPEEIY